MDCEQKLALLIKFGKLLIKENKLDTILNLHIEYLKKMINCERCTIFLYDKDNNEVISLAQHGGKPIKTQANKGVVGMTIAMKQMQFSNDVYNDFRFNKDVDKTTGFKTKSIISVPIVDKNQNVIGVFQALNATTGTFDTIDCGLIELMSSYLSKTLDGLNLNDELTNLLQETNQN
jgi:transcriptional regulator with GAF, ATPase, and Fis domain